ncbi:helix-turn-helix domain-containing protein [Sporosarcina sp. FSL K6-1540]|uniref:helix-turn-helix domain-containing protein n=1 Tax=Sporosarcina sp. FSL K6-1540 TaxID=2921555 RepID=UPI003159C996
MNFILSDKLRKLRATTNYTQSEFAKKIEVARTTYAMYEQGHREPDYEILQKIATFYNVSTDYLLGMTDNPNHSKSENKDEKDIAKRLEEFKKDLTSSDGLNFSGEPMSEDAKESLIEAMDHIFRQTQRINKKFIPKKHRQDED